MKARRYFGISAIPGFSNLTASVDALPMSAWPALGRVARRAK